MEHQKRNFVEWAMHYRKIVILVVCCLVAFGMYSLPDMRKNEFPDYIIRQGVVIAAAPGVPADEIAEQVAKPLEDYIFSYKEVKKAKTFSKSTDGMVYIQVELNDDITDKDAFWNRFRHGVADFKAQLPGNVLAIKVMDDFGDTSALLITMESDDKTYRELSDYMDALKDSLCRIESVGRMTVSGMRQEQIAIYVDNERLAHYGMSDQTLAIALAQKGFTTSGGRVKTADSVEPIYVEKSLNSVYDIRETIVYTSPDGIQYNQHEANRLSTLENIIILCGHYKGVDQRVRDHLITREISIGDYVLTGGELAACIIADSVVRIIPGAIGDESSALTDSFQDNLLAPPVYTRPAEFRGWRVPDVLLSGNFAEIEKWQDDQAWERTRRLRPDLLENGKE